jgi:hypothetical protein
MTVLRFMQWLEANLCPWTWAGLAIMLTTGPLMFSADATRDYVNPFFRIKITCLVVAVVYNFTLHRLAARSETPGIAGILAACVSLLLWSSVLGAGRMIAFV